MFNEMKIIAEIDNLRDVMNFAHDNLKIFNFNSKINNKVAVVVDEIFSNIARYAYPLSKGYVIIQCMLTEDKNGFIVRFIDEGMKFNPLSKIDPNVTLSADDREVGGLGIFLVKKLCKKMEYKYENKKNILTLTF